MLVSLQGGLIEINPFKVVTVRRSATPVTLHITAGP